MRVSFDYDDWRRILIAQDVECLRCITYTRRGKMEVVVIRQRVIYVIFNLQYGWNG